MKFSELSVGDKCISLPFKDDPSSVFNVFLKTSFIAWNKYRSNPDDTGTNAIRLIDGVLSFMPDDMQVLKVLL